MMTTNSQKNREQKLFIFNWNACPALPTCLPAILPSSGATLLIITCSPDLRASRVNCFFFLIFLLKNLIKMGSSREKTTRLYRTNSLGRSFIPFLSSGSSVSREISCSRKTSRDFQELIFYPFRAKQLGPQGFLVPVGGFWGEYGLELKFKPILWLKTVTTPLCATPSWSSSNWSAF